MYKLPENLDNKYRFVTLASKRAEQLQGGAVPRVAAMMRKSTVLAQAEVAAGVVDSWEPEQQPVESAGDDEEE